MSYKQLSLLISACFLLFVAMTAIGYLSAQKSEPNIIVLSEPDALNDEEDSPTAPEIDSPMADGGIEVKNKIVFDTPKAMYEGHFYDLDGNKKTWSDYEGKFLLVNFWATWCAPCVVELPTLQELGEKFKNQNFEVIAISIDMAATPEKLSKFLDGRMLSNFAGFMDTDRILQKNIPMRGIPTTFLLNPKGELMYVFEGESNWSNPPAIDFFHRILTTQATQ